MKAALKKYRQFIFAPVLIVTALLTKGLPMSNGLRSFISTACFALAGLLLIIVFIQAVRLLRDIRRSHEVFLARTAAMREEYSKGTRKPPQDPPQA